MSLSAHSSDVRYNVSQALQAGLEVSIHEKPITQDGWSGAGYTTIDPNTGAGGYLIEGGSSGGVVEDSFANRYLDWVNSHMITNKYVLSAATLLTPFLQVTKQLFGFQPYLGSKNPYTSIARGLTLRVLGLHFLTTLAGALGRLLAVPAAVIVIFVGFYNVTILLQGLFYAKRDELNDADCCDSYWA